MNILLALFKYFPQGGLQKDTLRFAQEAARRGHNLTIFCSSWQGDKPEGINVLAQPIHAWTNYGAMESGSWRVRRRRHVSADNLQLPFESIP